MKLIFDIETDGLLDSMTRIHCLVAMDVDTKQVYRFTNPVEPIAKNIADGVKLLNDADELIGHNAISFDVPALQRLYPSFAPKKVTDTLLLSRLLWSDRAEKDRLLVSKNVLPSKLTGSHSLKAWGYRLATQKGEFHETTDWAEFSEEMLEYCVKDVELTLKLYQYCMEQACTQDAIDLEHAIHQICYRQEVDGFPFDVKKAGDLHAKLVSRRLELEESLAARFGSWCEPLSEVVPKRTITYKDPSRPSVIEGCPYTAVAFQTFNPLSRHQIADRLIKLRGWTPTEFTESGDPKVDEDVLSSLDWPEAKELVELFTIQKRLGQLAEGNQAWLKLERNGRIHGRMTTCGTLTHRCSHQSPNLGQVPSVNAAYGHECRELFYAPPGWKMLGVDVSGLELRLLAHMLAKWDNGEYAEQILSGDIHTFNQQAAGLETRAQAKTLIYAWLYSAGDAKIGSIIGRGAKEGKQIKQKLLSNIPALKNFTSKVAEAVAKRPWVIGLDGRRIPIRAPRAAVNTLLQGNGAIVCKRWVVTAHQMLEEAGYVSGRDYQQCAFVHDELQVLVKENNAEDIASILVTAINRTGSYYGLRIRLDGEYRIGNNWAETH